MGTSTAGADYFEVSEIEFQVNGVWMPNNVTGSSSGTVAGLSGFTIRHSSMFMASEEGWRVFDGISLFWSTEPGTCNGTGNGGCFEWVEVDFGIPVMITGYRLKSGFADPLVDQYRLEVYDSGGWVILPGSECSALESTSPSYSVILPE